MNRFDKIKDMGVRDYATWYADHILCTVCEFKSGCHFKYQLDREKCVSRIEKCLQEVNSNTIPTLRVGDILTSSLNRTFIVVAEGFGFSVMHERVDAITEILENNDIVDVSRVDDCGVCLSVWNKDSSEDDNKDTIIYCKDCKYFQEKHYEDEGEEPYIKYSCGNKCGMPKYAVKKFDFCSRAERISD